MTAESERSGPTTAVEHDVLNAQQDHWHATFAQKPAMFGTEPSQPARAALDLFAREGVHNVLELGAGQGRDTVFFAAQGLRVHAVDYTASAVDQIRWAAQSAGTEDRVQVTQHDIRERLPFADGSFDACYSHMLFCMALTTAELERLAGEVRLILRPGGLHVYTVRTIEDPHYRAGIDRGDDMFEVGGFVVHFFAPSLIERLAAGYELLDVTAFEESALPRRLVRVTMRRRDTDGRDG